MKYRAVVEIEFDTDFNPQMLLRNIINEGFSKWHDDRSQADLLPSMGCAMHYHVIEQPREMK